MESIKISNSNQPSSFDVAIIGLGPVGCTAAILLAEAGLSVVAIERDKEVYKLPRAVNLDGEIIRAFQKVGRGQAVADLMQPIRPGDRAGFANSKREWLFGQDSRAFGRNGWQPMNMFDQPEFESYLRAQTLEHDGVTPHIGFSVSKIENCVDDVIVTFAQAESSEQIAVQAKYVIACDGASSPTRKSFAIDSVDLGYDHDWLVVDVIARDGHTLNNSTLQVCDPDRIHTYVCTKDPFRRWEFKMLPGETAEEMLQEERIYSLIDHWTPRGTYEIRRAAVYQFHASNAERWRVGRVFIAGDAAHQTPPFLGQGMNTGMRDVINLAWKLPLVLDGRAEDSLLDSYFSERAGHAHDLVDWAVSIGRLIEHTAEQERCEREGLPPPQTPDNLQSSGYGQGREQPPIRDGVVMVEQITDSGSVGQLFNQPVVRRVTEQTPGSSSNQEFRLDTLLGSSFSMITSRELDTIELSEASRATLARLNASIVSLAGLEAVQGRMDTLFKDSESTIVRPDRLVFGQTTPELSLDELIARLANKLNLVE